ncbi:LCP family protein [Mycobacteroides sp. PCS013]|uniref:LCP family protein n=1 Tax=Mycobacteroides sp. PCS013 TaxID=3074106 RepID=UPI003C2D78B6
MTLVLVGFCTIVGTAFWIDGRLHRVDALTDYPERPLPGSGTNWLLVGSDSRQALSPEQEAELSTGGDTGDGRTDTILVVHIPAFYDGGPATMVSLPRDSYVPIPGYGSDKINAAFTLGGAALLTQTVEQATGLRMDHYAEIGFGGFASVVDAVGGVSMCLDEPIDDPLAGVSLAAECQILNGPNALGYVRSRATPRADLDRMTHQRIFMAALFHRVSSPAVWANPFRWYPLATSTADAITVAQGDHSWNLAQLGLALTASTQNLTMPIGSFSSNWAGDVVTWDEEASARLFEALRTGQPVPADLLPDPATPTP